MVGLPGGRAMTHPIPFDLAFPRVFPITLKVNQYIRISGGYVYTGIMPEKEADAAMEEKHELGDSSERRCEERISGNNQRLFLKLDFQNQQTFWDKFHIPSFSLRKLLL
jgi:hypothetical protein